MQMTFILTHELEYFFFFFSFHLMEPTRELRLQCCGFKHVYFITYFIMTSAPIFLFWLQMFKISFMRVEYFMPLNCFFRFLISAFFPFYSLIMPRLWMPLSISAILKCPSTFLFRFYLHLLCHMTPSVLYLSYSVSMHCSMLSQRYEALICTSNNHHHCILNHTTCCKLSICN